MSTNALSWVVTIRNRPLGHFQCVAQSWIDQFLSDPVAHVGECILSLGAVPEADAISEGE